MAKKKKQLHADSIDIFSWEHFFILLGHTAKTVLCSRQGIKIVIFCVHGYGAAPHIMGLISFNVLID